MIWSLLYERYEHVESRQHMNMVLISSIILLLNSTDISHLYISFFILLLFYLSILNQLQELKSNTLICHFSIFPFHFSISISWNWENFLPRVDIYCKFWVIAIVWIEMLLSLYKIFISILKLNITLKGQGSGKFEIMHLIFCLLPLHPLISLCCYYDIF